MTIGNNDKANGIGDESDASGASDAFEAVDTRLARLSAATASVRPRADFAQRVMAATAAANANAKLTPRGFWDDLPRIARRLVPVAALAAAIGVAWGVTNNDIVDDALAGSYAATELEW